MTEQADSPTSDAAADGDEPATTEQQATGWSPEPAASASTAYGSGAAPSDRPEVMIGAAFVGGLLAAQILKRLAR